MHTCHETTEGTTLRALNESVLRLKVCIGSAFIVKLISAVMTAIANYPPLAT